MYCIPVLGQTGNRANCFIPEASSFVSLLPLVTVTAATFALLSRGTEHVREGDEKKNKEEKEDCTPATIALSHTHKTHNLSPV